MVAVDAGPMQIQFEEGAVLRCAVAVPQGTRTTPQAKKLATAKKYLEERD
jgi:hypothetical protein